MIEKMWSFASGCRQLSYIDPTFQMTNQNLPANYLQPTSNLPITYSTQQEERNTGAKRTVVTISKVKIDLRAFTFNFLSAFRSMFLMSTISCLRGRK